MERRKAPIPLIKKTIHDRLYAEFIEARQNKCNIKDSDFRDWAINIAGEIGISNFQASGTWITRFKQVYRIRSRKITKFVSRNIAKDEAMIEQSTRDFLVATKSTVTNYAMSAVYNAEQLGFEREMHNKRTLYHVGEKHINSRAVNALTHSSYTIMSAISMDVGLLPRSYICLQVPKGSLGPRVL